MTQNTGMAIRDQEIIADLRNGMTGREVARKYGLTPGRISQIAKGSLDTDGPVDELRDWLVQGYLGDLRILYDIATGPGRPITSGKGDHVIDMVTGQPAYDPSPRIDAIAKAGQVRKNVAMLAGAEKPPEKPIGEVPDYTAHVEWVGKVTQELNQLRARADEADSLRVQLAAARERLHQMESNSLPVAEVVEE